MILEVFRVVRTFIHQHPDIECSSIVSEQLLHFSESRSREWKTCFSLVALTDGLRKMHTKLSDALRKLPFSQKHFFGKPSLVKLKIFFVKF